MRNIESALSAALGLDIDRRIVSVAQADAREVSGNGSRNGNTLAPEPGAPQHHAPASTPRPAPTTPRRATPPTPPRTQPSEPDTRLVFAGLDVTSDATRAVLCRVTLRHPDGDFVGEADGLDTHLGRCEAGARAVFAALDRAPGEHDLVLEGVSLVDVARGAHVLVAAHALEGRQPIPLVGVAELGRSAEEAGVLAALQAANRWITRATV